MSHPEHRATIVRLVRAACAVVVAVAAGSASAQVPEPGANAPKANWAAWDKWSTANMRGTTFSQSVNPKWFGESDTLFYSWRDTKGTTWYMVNAFTKAKKPLFDHVKLAAQLSVLDYLGDVPWDRHPGAKLWYSRIKSRPSFRPLLADRLPGLKPPEHYDDLDF